MARIEPMAQNQAKPFESYSEGNRQAKCEIVDLNLRSHFVQTPFERSFPYQIFKIQ
jgi:hypothetical protein